MKALIDLNITIDITNNDWNTIENITKALAPFKVAVESLCREDASLLTPVTNIDFIFQSMAEMDSDVSQELSTALQYYSKKRPGVHDAIRLLVYLH